MIMCTNMGKKTSNINNKITAFTIEKDGVKMQYFFLSKGGNNYYKRSIQGTPKPTPQNMTASEFRSRAISNGAKVKNISSAQVKKLEKQYGENKKKTDKILDQAYVSDRHFVKGSRSERKVNRGRGRGI